MTRIGRAHIQRPRSSKELEETAPPAREIPKPSDTFAPGTPRAEGPGGQLMWTDAAVDVQRDRGREQGGFDAKKSESNRTLAVQHEGPLEPAKLSALAEQSGIPPERQDAAQLVAATAYVNRAATPGEQQARLGKALDNLTVLDRIGPPRLQEKEFVELMWSAARIPGHAIDNLPPDRRAKAFETIAAALNTPGQHQLKVEKYDVKLNVAEGGQVLDTSTRKPSPWKTIGKIALNVGLGVAAAFTGGAALVAVKAAQLGISAYQGVKSAVKGDWLGAIGGFAGAFGGVAGATTGSASTATKIANTVTRGAGAAQGAVNAVRTRSVAGVLGAASEGLGAVSSFSPGNARLAQAATTTARTAQAAAAVESAARGDLLGAATQALSLGADRSVKLQRLAAATAAASAGQRGDWGTALDVGAALAQDLTRGGRLEDASRLLSGVQAVRTAQAEGNWARASQELVAFGAAAHELFGEAPLSSRPLNLGTASLAPAVTGASPSPLDARSLNFGVASTAPALRGAASSRPAPVLPREDVRVVQNALRATGLQLTTDGLMGPQTRAALKQFQRENGLRQTGEIDAATLQALGRERDVAHVTARPAAQPDAAARLRLDLARADVNLQLDGELHRTRTLLAEGNRGAAVAHAAQRYLDALQHVRSEVRGARDRYELEAAQYAMRTPGDVLNKLVTVDRNLNRDLKEVGKLWLSTAATTVGWFAPPVALAATLTSGAGTALLSEGTLTDRLGAGGLEVLKNVVADRLAARFGTAVARQLDHHLTPAALEQVKTAIKRGVSMEQIVEGFMSLGAK